VSNDLYDTISILITSWKRYCHDSPGLPQTSISFGLNCTYNKLLVIRSEQSSWWRNQLDSWVHLSFGVRILRTALHGLIWTKPLHSLDDRHTDGQTLQRASQSVWDVMWRHGPSADLESIRSHTRCLCHRNCFLFSRFLPDRITGPLHSYKSGVLFVIHSTMMHQIHTLYSIKGHKEYYFCTDNHLKWSGPDLLQDPNASFASM
jgi:hypothetical protein